MPLTNASGIEDALQKVGELLEDASTEFQRTLEAVLSYLRKHLGLDG